MVEEEEDPPIVSFGRDGGGFPRAGLCSGVMYGVSPVTGVAGAFLAPATAAPICWEDVLSSPAPAEERDGIPPSAP